MLTEKQSELLRFIHARLQKTGVPPSFDEMKDALDLKSKSGIHRLIMALEERGFIRRLPNRARALEVLRLPEQAAADAVRPKVLTLLNRIWETGAYTVHLCMQDGLWDAPKRDRGRWVGDLDVEGRVLLTAFGDATLLEDTLRRLAEETPAGAHVNGIPSYTALWITSLQTLYQHTGDKAFVESQKPALLRFLARMDEDFGPDNLLKPSKSWGFVDWAPGMYGQTEATRMGTALQFLRGFRAGVELLEALVDASDISRFDLRSKALQRAAAGFLDPATSIMGTSWQLNSLAVLTRRDEDRTTRRDDPVWREVLSHVKQDSPADPAISPYFGAYLLDAMRSLGRVREGIDWVRTYWGGMLAEGATSFWESYDLRWPKGANFALSLQADGTSGYFVSLAHGWSAGPTAWLTENVLGVSGADGYRSVSILPQLSGLAYVRGTVPTPHGPIVVNATPGRVEFDLPAGVQSAYVLTQIVSPERALAYIDGKLMHCTCSGDARGGLVTTPGHHVLELQ